MKEKLSGPQRLWDPPPGTWFDWHCFLYTVYWAYYNQFCTDICQIPDTWWFSFVLPDYVWLAFTDIHWSQTGWEGVWSFQSIQSGWWLRGSVFMMIGSGTTCCVAPLNTVEPLNKDHLNKYKTRPPKPGVPRLRGPETQVWLHTNLYDTPPVLSKYRPFVWDHLSHCYRWSL